MMDVPWRYQDGANDGVPGPERVAARCAAGVPTLDGDFAAQLRLFETCLSRLNDSVIIGDLDENGSPRIIYVNDAFVRRTGYARIEVIGGSPRILSGPETQLDAIARLEAAVAACRPQREELLCYTKAGERIWLEVDVSPVVDASGRAAHWISVERDITERKRTEEELRRSEEHYRVLFANNPLPMWVYDLDTLAFLAVNDAAIDHYGYTREQFLSMTIGDIRPPEDLGALWHSVRTGEDGLGKSGVWRHRTADGRTIRVEISSYSLMFHGRPARLVLAHDVTNQLAAEEALRASEASLARAQRIAHLGSWELDIPSGRLRWSDEMYRMFGIAPRDFAATYDAFLAAVHPDDREAVRSAHHRTRAGEVRLDIEHRIVRPDGSICWVHQVGELQYDEAVTPIRLIGTVLDITSRKRHELLRAREGEILEAISSAKPLDTVLELAASTIEAIEPSLLATVLVPDERGTHLVMRASPSLPPAFAQAIGPVPIRELAGSCGTAAFRRRPVLIDDIERDPLSQDYRAAAAEHGLRACWSMPVFDSAANVVATLAVYRRERGLPSAAISDLIHRLRDLIAIAFERDRKDAELRASEERFRLLATSTNDAIWDWDIATATLWWNEGAALRYGITAAEPALTSWTRRIHPDDRDRVVSSFEAAVAGSATSWSAEYRFRRKDGTYAYVFDRGQIVRDATGRAIRAIGGMTDVSERRAVEEKLHEQATLLDKASDAIVVRGLGHEVLYWNRGAEALYGWSAAEARGRRFDELLFADRDAFCAATAATLAHGEWTGELVQRTREGRTVPVLARWTLLRDATGQPRSVLAISTDITERKRLEQQLLRSQRLESIGTLAGGIAHDLNNLLQPILMGVDCLRDLASDPERAEDLASIEACALRGANMVKQLLSFARGNDAEKKPMSIADVGEELSKLIRDTFPKNIQFAMAAEPELWSICANATQLHQLVLNLCVNARDAMPDGGKLTLSLSNVRIDDTPANTIGSATPGHYVMLEVRDTGTGIPPEVQERIFDPFFTTKGPGQGTGLGLSTVHAIVRGHEGFITLASAPGDGTTFRVYLPATTEAFAPKTTRATSTIPTDAGHCILLVDDEPYVRQMARRILEQHGYRVLVAASGIEAVSLFAKEREHIAAVLVDLSMPGIDGTTTIAALKQLDPEVRLVGASGLPSPEFVRSVHRFVAKPLSAAAMLEAVSGVIAR